MKLYTEDYLMGLATGIVMHSEIGEPIDKRTDYRFSVSLPPTIMSKVSTMGYLVCQWEEPNGEQRHTATTDRGIEVWYEKLTITCGHNILIGKNMLESTLAIIIEEQLIPKLVAVKWED